MREFFPCKYEDTCLAIGNNPSKCKDCETYKAKVTPKLAPGILNFYDHLIFSERIKYRFSMTSI